MEEVSSYGTLEQARNEAIKWLERLGSVFGPRRIEVGRLGVFEGREVGTSSLDGLYWRLRIDYDPTKGCHFNAEWSKGDDRKKKCFCFPGGASLASRLAAARGPR